MLPLVIASAPGSSRRRRDALREVRDRARNSVENLRLRFRAASLWQRERVVTVLDREHLPLSQAPREIARGAERIARSLHDETRHCDAEQLLAHRRGLAGR